MTIVKADSVAGCYVDSELVCWECLSDDEKTNMRQDKILTVSNIDNSDDYYFCDRCKKQIKSI